MKRFLFWGTLGVIVLVMLQVYAADVLERREKPPGARLQPWAKRRVARARRLHRLAVFVYQPAHVGVARQPVVHAVR